MKRPGHSPHPLPILPGALLRGRWVVGVAVVVVVHLGLLEWLSRHPQLGGGLAEMAEPEFNQALTLGSVQPGTEAATPRTASANAHPMPTVGQVVQARTVNVQPEPPPAPRPPKPPAPQPPRARPAPTPPPPAVPEPAASPPPQQAAAIAPEAPLVPESNASTTAESGAGSNANPGPSSADALLPTVQASAEVARQAAAPTSATPPKPGGQPTEGTARSPALPATSSAENNEQKSTPTLSAQALSATENAISKSQWLQAWPPSTRLSYSLLGYFRGDLHGSARVQWQRTGDQYQAQVAVSVGLFLDMRMTSQGRITPERLWPVAYQEDRRSKKRLVRMGDQQVVLDNGTTLPRPAALQDTASQFVQLSQDFASGRQALAVGKVIQVTLARPGGVDAWTYDVAALDTLATAMGPVQAYHLRPRPLADAKGSVAVDMWFAPALRYQPARIRLTLNPETWLELTLESATQAEAPEPVSATAPSAAVTRNPW